MQKFLAGVAAVALLAVANPASAAFIFAEGEVGGTSLHSLNDEDQTGNVVFGTVGVGGEIVTLSSTDTLFLNGSGAATIDADPLNNLLIDFLSGYTLVGFNVETPGGPPVPGGYSMTLSVNGGSTLGVDLFVVDPLAPPQKYNITATDGDLIDTLAFTFDPGVDGLKQVRLTVGDNGGGTAIPEPATWGLMIMGFMGTGAMMRRRRQALA